MSCVCVCVARVCPHALVTQMSHSPLSVPPPSEVPELRIAPLDGRAGGGW